MEPCAHASLAVAVSAARIIEFYGASETSFIAWTDSDSALPDHVVGHPFSNVEVRIDAPTPDQPGLIYVRSPMVFDDYVTLNQQADQPALLRDGDWLSVRDVGHLDEQGRLHLLGRQQRMLLTQGKYLFPAEVENILVTHPAIRAASVQGVPDAVRGVHVIALLQLNAGESISAASLNAWCRERLEPYKIPRRFYLCEDGDWPLTSSGKSDHPQLALRLPPHNTATLTLLQAHEIGAPVVHGILQRFGIPLAAIDAVMLANGLLAAGNADVVIVGGLEAWSPAPIRQHRPLDRKDAPRAYDSPAFAPDPVRGHPIGASGAISLLRLLADMQHAAPEGAAGMAAIAAVGGLGTAAIVERLA